LDALFSPLTEMEIYGWEEYIGDVFFLFALGFLAAELIRYALLKKLNWTLIGDTLTNYITLAMFIGVNLFLLAGLYLSAYLWVSQFAVFEIGISWATVLICVVLADVAYYWEHRFVHRVNIAWATHTVHHSSPFFNISVAYRFGPMDGVWPIFFHLPLVLLGFNPFVVLFAEMAVQLYQTALHTEWVKKFPKPIEAVMNTPSHHRVHHGSNPKYIDANYAGIFIIWDRLFGTFVEEDEEVVYGLVTPINSINPIIIFFHGFYRLGKTAAAQKGLGNKLAYFFRTPEWTPEHPIEGPVNRD
jgi:sterol desaturase/sphingolipid hydroxylase (fatty acid hydroxylase superfamily)